LLHISSLVLGLIAWVLPVVFLSYGKKKYWAVFPLLSMGACALSLVLQIFEIRATVKIDDWTALMDTIDAIAFAAAVLLAVALILNAAVLFIYREKTQ
jgi:cytochrome c oxidase subunit 4